MTGFSGQDGILQSKTGSPDSEFIRLVRDALAHLYDPAYLQNHPLVALLNVQSNADRVTRAQGLRRVLLECIEALRPEQRATGLVEATRAYAILAYHYVDGLSIEEIAGRMALSRRQAYREHRKGLEAVASLLWDRMQARVGNSRGMLPTTLATASDRLQAIHAEVDRLQQAAQAEPLDLQTVLDEVFELLAPLVQRAGIQITVSSPETWLAVVGDRVMLRQALLNLLSQALHVVRGDLVVTASRRKNGLLVRFRESPSTSRPGPRPPSSPEPDGVGLAVAQALIEAQGGQLEIVHWEQRWAALLSLPTSDRATVLVIDDNPDFAVLFQRYLAGHRVSVVPATDGRQALRLAAELQPQAITLDVMMPTQDGWEILRELKDSPDTLHIPVIVCSVLNEPELALAMGASDTITKPVNQVELLQLLQHHLGPLGTAA